jgi:hypothetical protein
MGETEAAAATGAGAGEAGSASTSSEAEGATSSASGAQTGGEGTFESWFDSLPEEQKTSGGNWREAFGRLTSKRDELQGKVSEFESAPKPYARALAEGLKVMPDSTEAEHRQWIKDHGVAAYVRMVDSKRKSADDDDERTQEQKDLAEIKAWMKGQKEEQKHTSYVNESVGTLTKALDDAKITDPDDKHWLAEQAWGRQRFAKDIQKRDISLSQALKEVLDYRTTRDGTLVDKTTTEIDGKKADKAASLPNTGKTSKAAEDDDEVRSITGNEEVDEFVGKVKAAHKAGDY